MTRGEAAASSHDIYIMAVSGVWVDCEIIENKDDDLCLYLGDRSIIMRDDLPDAQNGEILIIGDTIIL